MSCLKPGKSVLLIALAFVRAAHAEDDRKQECNGAYESAQVLRKEGDLIEAKKRLLICGGAQCPSVMHADCQRWLAEVESSTPSVVFQVKSNAATNLDGAQLTLDAGEVVELDGRAIEVNPGKHRVSVSAPGFATASSVLTILEGEKLRREVMVLSPLAAKTAAEPLVTQKAPNAEDGTRFHVGIPLVLAASAAALGGIGTAYFGLNARAKESDLAECSPTCGRDAVDSAKREFLLANVSLGLAAVGAVTASVFVIVELKSNSSKRQASFGLAPQAHSQPGLSIVGQF
jgi:hypothetical protein